MTRQGMDVYGMNKKITVNIMATSLQAASMSKRQTKRAAFVVEVCLMLLNLVRLQQILQAALIPRLTGLMM